MKVTDEEDFARAEALVDDSSNERRTIRRSRSGRPQRSRRRSRDARAPRSARVLAYPDRDRLRLRRRHRSRIGRALVALKWRPRGKPFLLLVAASDMLDAARPPPDGYAAQPRRAALARPAHARAAAAASAASPSGCAGPKAASRCAGRRIRTRAASSGRTASRSRPRARTGPGCRRRCRRARSWSSGATPIARGNLRVLDGGR